MSKVTKGENVELVKKRLMIRPLWDFNREEIEEKLLVIGPEDGRDDFQEDQEFAMALYWVLLNMTCHLYTKEDRRGWFEKEHVGKKIYHMVSTSDIAYTMYVLRNHLPVWEQPWDFSEENEDSTPDLRKKFEEIKTLSEAQLKRRKLSRADYNRFVPKTPRYTSNVKKEVMKDAVSNKGKNYFDRTESRVRNFLYDKDLMDLFQAHWEQVENEIDLVKLYKSKGYFNSKGEDGENDADGGAYQGGKHAKVYMPGHPLFEERLKELDGRDYGEESDYEQEVVAV